MQYTAHLFNFENPRINAVLIRYSYIGCSALKGPQRELSQYVSGF